MARTYPLQRRQLAVSISMAAAIVASLVLPAWAAPGAPDAGFARGGVFTVSPGGLNVLLNSWGLAAQADGRIVQSYSSMVALGSAGAQNGVYAAGALRLNPNGTPDTTFNQDGFWLGPTYSLARQMLPLPNGKYLVSGGSRNSDSPNYYDIATWGLTANGQPDTTFGRSGAVVLPVQGTESPFTDASFVANVNTAVQQDGKQLLLLGMRKYDPATNQVKDMLMLLRFLPSGQPDPGLNGVGSVMVALGRGIYPAALAEQADGRIVIVGRTTADALVLRLNSDGSPDISFGSEGRLEFRPGTADAYHMNAVAIQPDGKILYAASDTAPTGFMSSFDSVVGRLNSDGSPDAGFGNEGVVTQLFQTYSGQIKPNYGSMALALQPDGRIVVTAEQKPGGHPVMLRLLSDGQIDTGFAVRGVLPLEELTEIDGLALQPDGKILMSGHVDVTTFQQSGYIYRLLANDANNDGIAEPWGLAPQAVTFTAPQLSNGTPTVTDMVTISGLGAGVRVPVTAFNTEFALNGSTDYLRRMAYVGNGDRINLRFTAGTQPYLQIGGMHAINNNALILGPRITTGLRYPGATTASDVKVVNLMPRPGSTHVAGNLPRIMAVFSSALAPVSVNPATFQLACNGTPVAAGVALVQGNRVARLTPAAPLPSRAVCRATLSTGITTSEGSSLGSSMQWEFHTR